MHDETPVLSICTTCRDGREASDCLRGGVRLAQHILARNVEVTPGIVALRGVRCMSQCKRPCIASLCGHGRFTYVFGDLDPERSDHVDALLELVERYRTAPEGFLERQDRPEPLRANILGRLPPMNSASGLITHLGTALVA
ncbi:MAG: putative metal-binding protein [Gammaproteobacteria bacterium]|jgi:predicted metal-binding protein